MLRKIGKVFRGAIKGALNAITANDETSVHLDRMDEIHDAIEHGDAARAAYLIAEWPEDATAWQKAWLERNRPKP